MAIIQIPAKSIVGKPKLNIANDNTYESVGYSKKSTNFNFISFQLFALYKTNYCKSYIICYNLRCYIFYISFFQAG